MRNKISLEYAEALFTLACEENLAEEYLSNLQFVKEAINSQEDFLLLLRSPSLSFEEKAGVIDSVFGNILREHTLSFLKLLCQKGRIELLPLCIEDFEKLYNELNRVVVAEVTSAVPLTSEEKEGLKLNLEKKTGHRVQLLCQVDENILGGIIVRTEDYVLDGSLKEKIHRVKEVIKSEPKA